jgi:hypothetical protein
MSSTALVTKTALASQIQEIFDQHELDELKTIMHRRHCLNQCNLYLVYIFHLIQSAGILTTTIATGYNYTELIWVGVGLNLLASMINIYEKTNAAMSKRLLMDIDKIKAGQFVDEGAVDIPLDVKPNAPMLTPTLVPINPDDVNTQ